MNIHGSLHAVSISFMQWHAVVRCIADPGISHIVCHILHYSSSSEYENKTGISSLAFDVFVPLMLRFVEWCSVSLKNIVNSNFVVQYLMTSVY